MKKVHKFIKFNQEAWLKPYNDINPELRNGFEKEFFKLFNKTIFRKAIQNVRKHRGIKLVTTEARKNYLVSEQNYHITKIFSENLLAIEMKRTQNSYE